MMDWSSLLVWAESHDKLAAWVQAVGSVAAIVAAIWIGYRQNTHQAASARKAAEEREKTIRSNALAMITHLAETTANMVALLRRANGETPHLRALVKGALEDAIAPLRGIPFYEVSNLDLLQLSLGLVRAAGLTTRLLETDEGTAQNAMEFVLSRANEVLEQFGEPRVSTASAPNAQG